MNFTKGNLALRDHLLDGKQVYLFQYVKKGHVKFISELEFYDVGFFDTPDTFGKIRVGIRFFFKRKGAHLPAYANELAKSELAENPIQYGFQVPTEKESLVINKSRPRCLSKANNSQMAIQMCGNRISSATNPNRVSYYSLASCK
jgi:hypothetical protein